MVIKYAALITVQNYYVTMSRKNNSLGI